MKYIKPVSPLRYPGGKSIFFPVIKAIINSNELEGGEYFEPFAGGAAVGLELLFSGVVSRIHINDIDVAVYSFWKSIIFQGEDFLDKLERVEINIEEWERQRYIINNLKDFSTLEIGFAAFFLNRTNRSGILKAGVIGGKNQNGKYKLDARFNKENLKKRILQIQKFSDKICVYNEDAINILCKSDVFFPDNTFIYLDPPYYNKGNGLYRNFYKHQDHVAVESILKNIRIKWIVSYDNCKEIREIYKDYNNLEYSLRYHAYNNKIGSEILFYNNNLNISDEVKNYIVSR